MIETPCISLIVACAHDHVIGYQGGMPWHLPADLQYFKHITMGKPIIMGSTTHKSIGRPLPGRRNIVISRNPDFEAPGCEVAHSIGDAIAKAGPVEEIMVIGGAKIYALALPLAHRIYLTEIDLSCEGDTHFPPLGDEWHEASRQSFEADDKHPAYSFVVLQRHQSEDI
ncbi:MAG: dihydrofolate reductase [Sphingomonadales bacterium]|jgi:dihydrofolate reductase